MEKQFRIIPSFPKYLISNTGTIINIRKGTIRKQRKNHNGYMTVGMFQNKKRTTKLVHRLMCEAFYGEQGYPQVNHKNGVRHDNRIENLEWCSASMNNYHAFRILKRPLPAKLLTGQEQSKQCVVTKGVATGTFLSIKSAAQANGCPKHIFIRIANGKRTHKSNIFEVEYI